MLAILLIPAIFITFYKRGKKDLAVTLTALAAGSFLIVISFTMLFNSLNPEKFAYHISPNGGYIAIEYAFTMIPGGTDVLLYRVNGPLLIKKRVLYLANYADFGGKIEWLDDSNIRIYGEKMDVFKDPVIENYIPF